MRWGTLVGFAEPYISYVLDRFGGRLSVAASPPLIVVFENEYVGLYPCWRGHYHHQFALSQFRHVIVHALTTLVGMHIRMD